MKPFALDTVLRYRQQLEDSAVTKLIEAQKAMELKKANLHQADIEYQDTLRNYGKLQRLGIGIDDLLRYETRLEWLQRKKKKLSDELHSAQLKVERRRQIVVAKSRDKKVLDQLKEKQNTAWKKYQDKKETAQLDEMAILGHERKQLVR